MLTVKQWFSAAKSVQEEGSNFPLLRISLNSKFDLYPHLDKCLACFFLTLTACLTVVSFKYIPNFSFIQNKI